MRTGMDQAREWEGWNAEYFYFLKEFWQSLYAMMRKNWKWPVCMELLDLSIVFGLGEGVGGLGANSLAMDKPTYEVLVSSSA